MVDGWKVIESELPIMFASSVESFTNSPCSITGVAPTMYSPVGRPDTRKTPRSSVSNTICIVFEFVKKTAYLSPLRRRIVIG